MDPMVPEFAKGKGEFKSVQIVAYDALFTTKHSQKVIAFTYLAGVETDFIEMPPSDDEEDIADLEDEEDDSENPPIRASPSSSIPRRSETCAIAFR